VEPDVLAVIGPFITVQPTVSIATPTSTRRK
jgi:hypothetical protein